ncbi:MAG: phosphocholine cytidylyltransferase family protein [Deltaproteobacteria bacterium]|nr:phosphocholine cytidylyltransferase family protein [Deltaproteobacteria bacterium]
MKAIILAAGIGERLRPITDARPKCLVEVGGMPVFERMLATLKDLGVCDIVAVVGYRDEMIRKVGGKRVRYIQNDEYRLGNIVSVHKAAAELATDCLLMDADVIAHPALYAKIIGSAHGSAFLMDRGFKDTGEEMKLGARHGRVLTIARRLEGDYDAVGEGVGFLKLNPKTGAAFATTIAEFVAAGKTKLEYENALDEFLKAHEVGYEEVAGLPWTEIDFVQDIAKAERDVLPRIENGAKARPIEGEQHGA